MRPNCGIFPFITWGVRCDQSESWTALEYIMHSTVILSETAMSKRMELLKLRLQVTMEALATCNPKAVIGQVLPPHSPPLTGFSTTSHLEWNNYRTLESECQTHPFFGSQNERTPSSSRTLLSSRGHWWAWLRYGRHSGHPDNRSSSVRAYKQPSRKMLRAISDTPRPPKPSPLDGALMW